MINILRTYADNGFEVTEYTIDGSSISHIEKKLITSQNPNDEIIIEPQQYEPTNSELAQMLSDLQADLIIAGVI